MSRCWWWVSSFVLSGCSIGNANLASDETLANLFFNGMGTYDTRP